MPNKFKISLICIVASYFLMPCNSLGILGEEKKIEDQAFLYIGPTFAYPGVSMEPNTYDVEFFNFFVNYKSSPEIFTLNPMLYTTFGIAKRVDLSFYVPYYFNNVNGHWPNGFGDVFADLGIQFIQSKENSIIPNSRLIIEQIFPNGKYSALDADLFFADAFGLGSNQTGVGFALQQTYRLHNTHYLNIYLNFLYYLKTAVPVCNLTIFGGEDGTNGVVHAGNGIFADIAFEYQLDKHWDIAFETIYTATNESTFSGIPGPDLDLNSIGAYKTKALSLAPEIEYNFNSNWGLSLNGWFSVYTKNTSSFNGGVIALNYFAAKAGS